MIFLHHKMKSYVDFNIHHKMKLEEIGNWHGGFLDVSRDQKHFFSEFRVDFAGSDSQMERPGDLDAEKVPIIRLVACANHPNPCGSHKIFL